MDMAQSPSGRGFASACWIVLDGLTTAIIVDQERMGSDPRSTVGTVTDTGAMLRILWSRLGTPHIGSAKAFSFNIASISGAGAVTLERGGQKVKERRSFSIVGGMCPRCEGRGSVTDVDLSALYDDTKSLNEGALTIPGYTMDGWYGRIYRGCGYFDPDKPIAKFTQRELRDLLYKEPTRIKVEGINLTYEGLIPKIQKSMLSKDVDALQPHIRAFVERAITFTTCPDCGGTRLSELARSSKIKGINIAEACAMSIKHTRTSALNIYLTLRSLVTGRVSYKELHGPIGIAKTAYRFAQEGWVAMLLFLGFLSVNLAVLNFLPIPVLDGGHMVFLIWEACTRKKPNERFLIGATYVGFVSTDVKGNFNGTISVPSGSNTMVAGQPQRS